MSLTRWRYDNGMLAFQRRRPRREFEARIYTGLPGSGKTLAMVADCVKLMRAGVVIGSNIAITDPIASCDPANPNLVVGADGVGRLVSRPVGGWVDIMELLVDCLEAGHPVVFAIDEIHVIADAQSTERVPPYVMWLITQRRKFGSGMIGTSQDLEQVKKRVRALVDRVVAVRPFVPAFAHKFPLYEYREVNLRAYDLGEEQRNVRSDWGLMPWYAFEAYDTAALCAIEQMKSLKEEDNLAYMDGLAARAYAAAQRYRGERPVYLPAVSQPLTEGG